MTGIFLKSSTHHLVEGYRIKPTELEDEDTGLEDVVVLEILVDVERPEIEAEVSRGRDDVDEDVVTRVVEVPEQHWKTTGKKT